MAQVVLAYSGGLDTSVILKWLQDEYDCEVVTFTADLGQVRQQQEGGSWHSSSSSSISGRNHQAFDAGGAGGPACKCPLAVDVLMKGSLKGPQRGLQTSSWFFSSRQVRHAVACCRVRSWSPSAARRSNLA